MDILLGVTALALVAALVWRHAAQRKIRALNQRVASAETHANEQSRIVADIRSDQRAVGNLALSLPSVVRELNSDDLNIQRVPGLILQLAEAVFQPGQILFYQTVMASSSQGNQRELRLIAHRGLDELPEDLRRITIGYGKLGWIAENKFVMFREDWIEAERNTGILVEDNHPILEADIVGPLIHATVEGDQILGVLCIGSPAIKSGDEKSIFQFITDLGSLAMVTAQQRSRLVDQANHDDLTGLLNVRSFEPKLEEMIVEAVCAEKPMGLFILDIDDFKTYKRTDHRVSGDELLSSLGELLRNSVRPDDLCCRWGGEKFMVAMPGSDWSATFDRAERIRKAIEEFQFPPAVSQSGNKVTISGGVAIAMAEGATANSLITLADKHLYEAKRLGGNRVSPPD